MSRRAAARLESFGFENVCIYVPGKQDWLSFELPFEGDLARDLTAGAAALREVPVCGPLETLAQVRGRLQQSGWAECVVANEQRIVLGLVSARTWQADGRLPVEQVMDPAPLTVRPHTTCAVVADRMQKQQTEVALVTYPDGKLIGLLRQGKRSRQA
jgi:CBS domain-containing protein